MYLKIKQDPKDIRFNMLFELDKNNNAIPIQGQTLKLMEDGVPFILDQATAAILNGDASQDPLESVRTNKTFREIRNEIALESPFGENSIFYKRERNFNRTNPKIINYGNLEIRNNTRL